MVSITIETVRDCTSTGVQLAEINFYDSNGAEISWFVVSVPQGDSPSQYTPLNLYDNSASTKWYDRTLANCGDTVTLDIQLFGTPVRYTFTTAGDLPGRDPASWTITLNGASVYMEADLPTARGTESGFLYFTPAPTRQPTTGTCEDNDDDLRFYTGLWSTSCSQEYAKITAAGATCDTVNVWGGTLNSFCCATCASAGPLPTNQPTDPPVTVPTDQPTRLPTPSPSPSTVQPTPPLPTRPPTTLPPTVSPTPAPTRAPTDTPRPTTHRPTAETCTVVCEDEYDVRVAELETENTEQDDALTALDLKLSQFTYDYVSFGLEFDEVYEWFECHYGSLSRRNLRPQLGNGLNDEEVLLELIYEKVMLDIE